MVIPIIGFLDDSKNDFDITEIGKKVLEQLDSKGFRDYSYTEGSNIVEINVGRMTELPDMVRKLNEVIGLNSFIVNVDHLKEVSDAIRNHEYFKAFSLCASLYESFSKKILISYIEKKGLSLNSQRIERLGLDSLILMLYTNGLISEGIYSDMISVNSTRNDQIHRYLDKFLSEDTLKDIEENEPKVMRSLEKLKKIYEDISAEESKT